MSAITSPSQNKFHGEKQIKSRHAFARAWQMAFFFSTLVAMVALATLLLTVIDRSFGFVAFEDKVNPSQLADRPLDQLSNDELETILRDNLTSNRIRTIERDHTV
jgi:phosphate transport system permease protein